MGRPKSSTVSRASDHRLGLNGLRGIASCIVFLFHGLLSLSPTVNYGYGGGENGKWLHQLPVIRLIYSGRVMVLLFHIISGYVLSLRPLRLGQSGSWDQVFHTLSSAVFRRGFRLFIPPLVSTFITMLLVYAGLFEYVSKKSAENLGHRLEKFELPAQRLNTLGEQCWHWITASWTMVNPWTWEKVLNPYNVNLWSLPAEFRSSIVLFIVVLGLARLKTCYRLLALSCVIWNAAVYHKWEVSATLAGMILAELDSSQGTDKATKTKSNGTIGHRARELSFFLVALYLASYPDLNGERTPGYRTLSHMIPAHLDRVKCWQTIGCMMVVHSVNHSSFIQKLFAGPLIQYLGEISYSVYIVHGPILHSVGVLAISYCWKHAGRSSLTQKYVSFALAAFTVTPVLFYAAHCFKKLVDVPCGRFTRWLEVYLTSVGTGK